MLLAGDGTRGCHGALTSKQRTWDLVRLEYIEPLEVACHVREWIEARPSVASYVYGKLGPDRLERKYPRRKEQ